MEFSLRMVCRTCMCEDGVVSSIFDSKIKHENNIYSFADMLTSCTNIQIQERDHLTEYICEECQKQLRIAFSFKKQSERVDSVLRKIGKSNSTEIVKSKQDQITTIYESNHINSKNNFLLSAEFLNDIQDEIPTINKPFEIVKHLNKKNFMLSPEFLDESTIIDEPTKIIKYPKRKRKLDKVQDEIATMDKSVEITNYKHNENEFMLFAEFLNDEILLNEDEDHNENKQSVAKKPTKTSKNKYHSKKKQCNKVTIEHDNKSKQHDNENRPESIEPIQSKSYCCELCGQIFHSPHGLNYHMKNHKGIKKHACPHPNCTKRFIMKHALDRHYNIHTGAKKYLCPQCGKTYPTNDGLYYHLRAHRGDRPHLCVHCGKTFIQACHLKTHMWVHSGIKPHVCKLCGNRYTTGQKLKKHMIKFCPSAL